MKQYGICGRCERSFDVAGVVYFHGQRLPICRQCAAASGECPPIWPKVLAFFAGALGALVVLGVAVHYFLPFGR